MGEHVNIGPPAKFIPSIEEFTRIVVGINKIPCVDTALYTNIGYDIWKELQESLTPGH